MRNILLIGGAGYVGSVLTSFLLKRNFKVTVLDNLIYNHHFAVLPFLGEPAYHFIYGDINNRKALEKASEKITDVVLLAGLVGDPITAKFPAESEAINDLGVKHCIDIFNRKSIDKFIFISTCSNYGVIQDHEFADEEFPLHPLSLYAKAKVANEHYLLSKKGSVDYKAVVLRFATAFGLSPRMRFDLTISEFVRDMYFDKDLLVYDEFTWRPYCHVMDFARLIEMVINAESEKVAFQVFNAGGNLNNYTKQMIVDEILTQIPDAAVSFGKKGNDHRNYRVSFDKVEKVLGFVPDYSVKDGISQLLEAFKNGFFNNSIVNPEKFGNYHIDYKF